MSEAMRASTRPLTSFASGLSTNRGFGLAFAPLSPNLAPGDFRLSDCRPRRRGRFTDNFSSFGAIRPHSSNVSLRESSVPTHLGVAFLTVGQETNGSAIASLFKSFLPLSYIASIDNVKVLLSGTVASMMSIDPNWEGPVKFYELMFGTWLAYIILVLGWEKVLYQPLDEWRYLMLNLSGAAAFLINHYFNYSPFYGGALGLLSLYTNAFLLVWYLLGVRGHGRSILWQIMATLCAVLYTIAYIGFENVARIGVDVLGWSEFWFMLVSYLGFAGIIIWRGRRPSG